MKELMNKISALCPQAQFNDEGEFLLVTVDDAQWHALAVDLKNKEGFDYLMALVGVDWKETLGCVYYITNTKTRDIIHVKVATADRENPRLHSVSDVWAVANYQEREVYDFYGIVFINHP
ncbi:MAG: NADH-quinone oxidoreductase subunit C, partial [Bacteroidales bacterium]|nr:NADH-quinone oxidoreductase subunit C [Candidatus Sodaliphilus aphodohippi]